jgi:hypothetical protein
MAIGTSILLIAVGAILRFAVTVTTSGVDIQTVGVILMAIGAIGLLVSLLMWSSWSGAGGPGGGYRRRRRVARDGSGALIEEERADRY